jgi:peroxiredoxin
MVGDDLIVYDDRTSGVMSLNATAAYMWVSFDGSRTVAMVAQDVSEDFGLDYAEALSEVQAFADGLAERGLLVAHAPDLAEELEVKRQQAQERAEAVGLKVRESRIQRNGLSIGTVAPAFTLPDLDGVEHSLADFRGKPVLLVFSDPHCGPCQYLAPDLARLHSERKDDLTILMISRGEVEENRAKVEEHGLGFPVLLQRQWEISKEYAFFGTPCGYLIDEDGVIENGIAVGGPNIMSMVEAPAAE